MSGWVSTAASARHGFGKLAQNISLKAKHWARNLGHELGGPIPCQESGQGQAETASRASAQT
eukprot:466015-Pyramimonas_sp.AAC.1